MRKRKEDWNQFCKIIIETNGNPTTKDAEKCGIPFGKWFEIATRVSRERLIENAKNVLIKMERKTQ